MKIQIHNYSTAKGGQRIGPYKFRDVLGSLSLDYIEGSLQKLKYSKIEDITQTMIISGVGLLYSYNPGLGSFPNEREKIEAFGEHNRISELCKILKERGLPINITIDDTKL